MEELKKRGNSAFARGKFKEALQEYSQVNRLLHVAQRLSSAQPLRLERNRGTFSSFLSSFLRLMQALKECPKVKGTRVLRSALHSNSSFTFANLGNADEAMREAREVGFAGETGKHGSISRWIRNVHFQHHQLLPSSFAGGEAEARVEQRTLPPRPCFPPQRGRRRILPPTLAGSPQRPVKHPDFVSPLNKQPPTRVLAALSSPGTECLPRLQPPEEAPFCVSAEKNCEKPFKKRGASTCSKLPRHRGARAFQVGEFCCDPAASAEPARR